MAFTADGRRLYVSQGNLDSVTVIDVKSNTVTSTLTLPAQSAPQGITLSHKGDRIYVANIGTATVSVFSTFDNHAIASIPVGVSPIAIALAPGDERAYVTDGGDNTVAIIDTASNTVVNTIAIIDPDAIVITQDGQRAYVANGFEGTVSVIDLALNQITGAIGVGDFPQPMTLGKNVARLNVGLANSDDVGIRFDLRAEVYRNGTQLLGSGQLSSMPGGSSGFDNSVGLSVPLSLGVPLQASSGDTLSLRLLVRNACVSSGKNSGRARLWYGDANADSRFDVISADGVKTPYYLGSGMLETSAGSGPRRSIDVAAGAKCSDFKEFGTWSRVVQ
jgi:YVTN family beta-propeller protein